ncbi:MAG TPA: OB-fold nucleic acid binding domain-containing protein, partial [Synergistaceae bacterium]|nr:OB-fold nucleic acid binding domain-containing protein [Synergistaceae bacterium]
MVEHQESLEQGQAPEEEILRARKDKLERLRSEEGYDPFQQERWDRKHTLEYVHSHYDHLEVDAQGEEKLVTAGRVMTLRKHGKASFVTLEDETHRLQLYFQLNALGEEPYNFFKKWVDVGDFLGIEGVAFRTRRGELSILVQNFTLLSKALRPLP